MNSGKAWNGKFICGGVEVGEMDIDPGWDNDKYKKSQVRVSGEQRQHVSDLVASIQSDGLQKPITVEKIPHAKKGKPQYRIIDGNHRFSALREINKLRVENKLQPLKINVDVRKYKPTADRERKILEEQMSLNNHSPTLKSSLDDIVSAFTDLVKHKGAIDISEMADTEAVSAIRDYIDKITPGYRQAQVAAKRVFNNSATDTRRIRSYTKHSAIDQWNNLHSFMNSKTGERLEWKRSGEDKDGIVVYFCDGHMDRTIGHVTMKRINTSPKKVVLVCWQGKSIGVGAQNIADYQKSLTSNAKQVNTFFKKSVSKMFDEVYFLPQVLTGQGKVKACSGLKKVRV